jgi:LacI family transcriptional regulator
MMPRSKSVVKRPVTLADVARHVNVSARTVSQVLSGSKTATTRVSEVTAKKVREAAQILNYRPNASARAMQGRGLRQIGFILEYDMVDGRVPPVIGMPAVLGVADYLAEKDWNFSIFRVKRGDLNPNELPLYLRENSQDGFILNSSAPSQDERILAELRRFDIPHVILNGASEFNNICVDNVSGIHQGMQHLIDLGHSRIVYVGRGSATHSSVSVRQDTYEATMLAAGLTPQFWNYNNDEPVAKLSESSLTYKQAQAARIVPFFKEQKPTAFICYSDMDALYISQALLMAGIRIPDDVSVLGYDDLPYVYLSHPALTTMRTDFYKLGWNAAEMLLQLIRLPSKKIPSVFLTPELVVRNSTRPPAS